MRGGERDGKETGWGRLSIWSAGAFLLMLWLGAAGSLAHAVPSRNEIAPRASALPASLLSLNEKDAKYALLVDKSEHRLYLYAWEADGPRLVKTYPCSTGENPGGKNRNGDKRTPNGVYFFTRVIEGTALPPIYGIRAFPMDYPNFLDRLNNKEGDGIWLHGTDQPLSAKSTRGCVVLENKDVAELSNYIRLHRTPIVIEEKISWTQVSELKKVSEQIGGLLEEWRQAWETKRLDRYMSFYAKNFRSGSKDWRGWRDHKERLNRQYRKIRVTVTDPLILRYERNTLIVFSQQYTSDRFSNAGTKRLYFDPDLKIIGEEWDLHTKGEAPPPIPENVLQAFLKPKPVKVAATTAVPSPTTAAKDREGPAGVSSGDGEQGVRDFVETWRRAWEKKDLDGYMNCYSRSFRAQGKGWDEWKRHKRALNDRYGRIQVSLKNLKIGKAGGIMRVSFHQNYRSEGISSIGLKSIEIRWEKNSWKIVRERFAASRTS